ncbi:acyl-CoA dehydrogenase family protein [Pelagerythrobacter rhizovicinus]|uniref:Acyl-CoA dehydrogenase/oxidase C-terminal domain-containing protein n=1 Tax=Pelagerythrobacter rhizovicinus TaxID=2268576 RepID=A0A4Q2KKA3_9SPHN|nr:acyl-CoA dehydrogenase family protein [Pelagerythrobacter rhizovicinus]RXZ64829.1 hypothetical protein ETX26_13305 [Pelagerythrobacter rhizovicinus]
MDDVSSIIFESAQRLLSDLSERVSAGRPMADCERADGWRQIEEMGLPFALMSEAQGGLGLSDAEAFELVRICGRNVVPWPLVDTMLANRFATQGGAAPAEGPIDTLGELTAEQKERAALARAMQMAGALDVILVMTISHVQERSQFGRPLAKFQAVQHSLAVLAGEVAAGQAAAEHAVARLARGGAAATLAIGIARARIGEACSKAAAIAHQLHGAIGYAREHRLHLYTTSLWRWRDEYGTQTWWTRQVGREVLAAGPDAFWPAVTGA